jgi:hypothetical protein
MRPNLLAVGAAALALGATSACATDTLTYTLDVQGSGTYFYYSGVPGGCTPGGPGYPLCTISEANVSWIGALQITTAYVQGVVTGADLEAVDFSANFGGFTYRYGDQQQLCAGDSCMNAYTGFDPSSSVTIENGRVLGLNLVYDFPGGAFLTDGLEVSEDPGGGGHASDAWWVTGTATQVPELASAWMLLAGLALLTGQRRLRPARAP